MLARARTCTCGRVSDTSSYTCGREPWLRCAPTRAGAYFCRTFRGLPSLLGVNHLSGVHPYRVGVQSVVGSLKPPTRSWLDHTVALNSELGL